MGSCVSLHRDPESAMKLRFSVGSKNDKLLIPSPVKQNSDSVNSAVAEAALKNQLSRGFSGSKEEAFFDSQPWLDSDCESDYHSINGDFTPSRGNTPVHHNFSVEKIRVDNNAPVMEGTIDDAAPEPSPSPPDKKKRLSELFKDSLRMDEPLNGEDNAEGKSVKSTNGMPYPNSGRSSERTPNREGESVKSAQCCFPGLLSSRSFNERKKRITSPTCSVGN